MLELLNKVPAVVRYIIVGLLLVGAFAAFSQVKSCQYDKERKAYEAEKQTWATDRARLLADAEAKEKRVAELEPQVLAFKAAAEAGKKVDEALVQKIEEVGKNAGEAEARAEMPVDCTIRAGRVCELLRTNNIKHDCGAITRESCGK